MKKLFIFLFSILICGQICAQNENRAITTFCIVPQYILNKGIRVDFERQISKKSFLQIGPQFYLAENINDDLFTANFSKLLGGGCGVFHKIFILEDYMNLGLYFGYGLTYNYFNIEYLEYQNESESLINGKINKLGADLIFGYQLFESGKFIADVYLGLGTRYSIMKPGRADHFFSQYYWDYNYTGNMIVAGLRLGFVL